MVITGQQVFDIDFLRYILADKCRLLAELPLPVFSPCSALSPVCAEERFLSAVERWIGKINVVFLELIGVIAGEELIVNNSEPSLWPSLTPVSC